MREILFQGKRLSDGEWIDGSLFIDEKKDKHEILVGYVNYRIGWEVDPKTVGQFTGLTDQNDKKIFDGAIVEATLISDLGCCEDRRTEIGLVTYDSLGMLGLVTEYFEDKPVFSDFFHELSLSGCVSDFYFKILGNIHDNPELISTTRKETAENAEDHKPRYKVIDDGDWEGYGPVKLEEV